MGHKAKREGTPRWRSIRFYLKILLFIPVCLMGLLGAGVCGFIILIMGLEAVQHLDVGQCGAALRGETQAPNMKTVATFEGFDALNFQAIDIGQAHNVVEVARSGRGTVNTAFWDADGNLLVLTSVGLWRHAKDRLFEAPEMLWPRSRGYGDAVVSPSAHKIAFSASYAENIPVLDVATGEAQILSLGDNERALGAIAMSSDDRFLAAEVDNAVYLWDLETGTQLQIFPMSTYLQDVVFSPDNLWVVSLGTDYDTATIRVWDVQTYDLVLEITSESFVDQLAFYPDANHLLGIPENGTQALAWSLPSGKVVTDLSFPARSRTPAVFSADQRYVVLENQLYDLTTQERIAVLSETYGFTLHFSPDSQWIAYTKDWYGPGASGLSLISLEHPQKPQPISAYTNPIGYSRLAFSQSGMAIESYSFSDTDSFMNSQRTRLGLWDNRGTGSSSDYYMRLCNAQTGTQIADLNIDPPAAFSQQGEYLVTQGRCQKIELRAADSGQVIWTEPDCGDWVRAFAFSPDDRLLAIARMRESQIGIDLVRVDTGERLQTLYGSTSMVRGMTFNEAGTLLVSFSADGTVRLWGLPIEKP